MNIQFCHLVVFIVLFAVTLKSTYAQDIRLPPTVTLSAPSYISYKEGDAIVLECGADGTPEPTYAWRKNDYYLPMNSGNVDTQSDGTIIISPTSGTDTGYYQCSATNTWGTAWTTVTHVEMAELGVFYGSAPTIRTASYGASMMLTCNPPESVPNATYSWASTESTTTEIQQPINTNSRIQSDPKTGNLYFANALTSDAMPNGMPYYMCNVYNELLDRTEGGSWYSVSVSGTSSFDRAPYLAFTISSPTTGFLGQAVILYCFFYGYPTPAITWSKSDGNFPIDRVTYINFDTGIIIMDLQAEDEGVFTCTGSNAAGDADFDIVLLIDTKPYFGDVEESDMDFNSTNGDTVLYTCNAMGDPIPQITWYQNGYALNPSNLPDKFSLSSDLKNLTISDVCKDCGNGTSNLQVLQCNATSSNGYAYAQGYLNVLLKTEITVPPNSQSLIIGQSYTFICQATSDPSTRVVISWLFNDTDIEYDDSIYQDSNQYLQIVSATEDNAGVYLCIANNGYSSAEANATLYESNTDDIRLPPSPTVTSPEYIAYAEGSEVTLLCAATGTPLPTYAWMKDDVALSQGNVFYLEDGNILIQPVTASDSGFYQCSASNKWGTAWVSKTYIELATLGTFTESGLTTYQMTEGAAMAFPCNPPASVPDGIYSWTSAPYGRSKMPETLIETSERVQISPDGNLHIAHLEESDVLSEGFAYKCNVYNDVMEETTGGSYADLILAGTPQTSVAPALAFVSSSPLIGLERQAVNFTCFFNGNPTPTIAWAKTSGDLVLPSYRVKYYTYNTIMEISDIQPTDAGSYECSGTNDAGSDNFIIQLRVYAAPEFLTPETSVIDTNATDGDNATFTCDPYGNPPPQRLWYSNGVYLNPSSLPPEFGLSDDTVTLTVWNVCKDCYAGGSSLMVIQCNASNPYGHSVSQGYLNVLLPTNITQGPLTQNLVYGDPLTLYCSATTDPAATVTLTWLFNGDQIVYNDDIYEDEFENLHFVSSSSTDEGRYTCVASNGSSEDEEHADLLPPLA